jgi:hypothetical protein
VQHDEVALGLAHLVTVDKHVAVAEKTRGHAVRRREPARRVAVAALEPHFAQRLMQAAGQSQSDMRSMFRPESHTVIAAFVKDKSRAQLDALSVQQDIPLFTLKG